MINYDKEQLIISGWEGLGNSSLSGFTYVRNVDNTDKGVGKVGYTATKKSGSTFDALPIQFSFDADNDGYIWAFTKAASNSIKQSQDSGNTWGAINGGTASACKGGVVWKGVVIAFRATLIDYYNGTWTTDWDSTVLTDTEHPVYKSVDDKIYFGNGKYLGTIYETAGDTFDPTDSASYTINTTALDLPDGYVIYSIVDNGDFLLIGATSPDGVGTIFPWDRFSSTYEQPIEVGLGDIVGMRTSNRLTYGFIGTRGQVFVTDGITSSLYAKLPETILSLSGISKGTVTIYREAMFIQDDKLYFGASATGAVEPLGVYTLDLNPRAGEIPRFTHINGLSTGEYGQTNGIEVGALMPIANGIYIMGVRDLNEVNQYFVDRVSDVAGEGRNALINWATAWQTEFINVGTATNKKTFNNIEIQFINEISNGGEGVRVSYRTNNDDAWTVIKTITANSGADTDVGTISSYQSGINLQNLEKAQFKIELGATTSNTPELFYIKFT